MAVITAIEGEAECGRFLSTDSMLWPLPRDQSAHRRCDVVGAVISKQWSVASATRSALRLVTTPSKALKWSVSVPSTTIVYEQSKPSCSLRLVGLGTRLTLMEALDLHKLRLKMMQGFKYSKLFFILFTTNLKKPIGQPIFKPKN